MSLVRETQQLQTQGPLLHNKTGLDALTLEEENRLAFLVRQGDERAFIHIYARYLKPVYSYFYRQTYNITVTEALTSETFIQIQQCFRVGVTFKRGCGPWLCGIASTIFQAWQKGVPPPQCQSSAVNELEEKGASIYDEILLQGQTKIIWDLLYQLPCDYQQILLLRYTENLSYLDIAIQMKQTVKDCKTLHGRAMKKLREIMYKENLGVILQERN